MTVKETVSNDTMAFSVVISSALPTNTTEEVERVFTRINFGELDHIDMIDAQDRRTGKPIRRFFIHYKSASPLGVGFRAGLDDRDTRQKRDGEIVEPIKIYYNSRHGREQFWKVYKAKTPAERLAEQAAAEAAAQAADATFTPRIEM